jgi:hypothetical protein
MVMSIVDDPNETAKKSIQTLPTHGVGAPRLALRSDGRVLLSTADLEGVDLSSRERWEGVLLSEAEARDVLGRVSFDEAAAKTAGHLIALDRKAKKESNGEE